MSLTLRGVACLMCLATSGVTAGCAPSPQQTAKNSIEQLGGKTRSEKGKVVKVDLRKSRATDNDLAVVRQFPALDRLSLPPAITDAGLRHLEGLPNLTSLDVQGTQVTDEGLAVVKTLPKLVQLYIHGSRITPAGAEALEASLPNLTIEKYPVAPLGPDFR
jgi:Leucine-rich repeat (LRR) protein